VFAAIGSLKPKHLIAEMKEKKNNNKKGWITAKP
jgi:hypothetical protein